LPVFAWGLYGNSAISGVAEAAGAYLPFRAEPASRDGNSERDSSGEEGSRVVAALVGIRAAIDLLGWVEEQRSELRSTWHGRSIAVGLKNSGASSALRGQRLSGSS
jgi:hypothetical protein